MVWGSREVIAPIASRRGDVEDAPALRIRRTRSCHERSPAVCQVSTSTSARSSDCPEIVVRRTNLSPAAHRASVSQLARAPSAALPRTWTSTQLLRGVRAAHEATSWVKSYDDATQGERHWPTS